MAYISNVKTPDGVTYKIKDAAKTGIYYITGSSSDTAGVWTGSHEDITAYFDGLTIIYTPAVAGVSGGTTLNINGLGAKSCYTTKSTALTTQYAAGTPILFTYVVTSGNGTWKRADYNSNTHYYTRIYAGTGSNANAQTTNGETKIYVADDSTVRTTITLQGSGATTVASNGSGVVTVNSPVVTTASIGAVPVARGSSNAGKFLIVNSSGNVEAVAMSVWQGGAY